MRFGKLSLPTPVGSIRHSAKQASALILGVPGAGTRLFREASTILTRISTQTEPLGRPGLSTNRGARALPRASDFGSAGRGFESLRARHHKMLRSGFYEAQHLVAFQSDAYALGPESQVGPNRLEYPAWCEWRRRGALAGVERLEEIGSVQRALAKLGRLTT